MSSTIDGNLTVRGTLLPNVLRIPDGTILDTAVGAGANIDSDKLIHRFRAGYAQANAAAADETRVIYLARAVGEVTEFLAGSIAKAVGDATCTVDLKKNGTSILSAVITLDNANTNRVAEAGTLTVSPTVLAAGDVLEIVIDGTIGTGTLPTGVFCAATINEDPT